MIQYHKLSLDFILFIPFVICVINPHADVASADRLIKRNEFDGVVDCDGVIRAESVRIGTGGRLIDFIFWRCFSIKIISLHIRIIRYNSFHIIKSIRFNFLSWRINN